MINFRKIKKNAKALSPVVASIILIAVTVAVSIAVAAWMGGLSVGFMQTEQLSLATPAFTAGSPGSISIVVKNTGTSAVTVSSMAINNVGAAFNVTSTPATIAANGQATFTITPDASTPIALGNNYQIKITTSKNNPFSTSAVAF
jgi:flagellin-like protein